MIPINDFEIYTYEGFCVSEILKSRNKGIIIKSRGALEGYSFTPDLYAPQGIPSFNMDGSTAIEIKKRLSFSSVKEIDALYDLLGDDYNILVVYYSISISFQPPVRNDKKKVLKYIQYGTLKGKMQQKDEGAYYIAKANKQGWRQERAEIIKRAQAVVEQGNNVLFLGAGVSLSAKMPSWKDLLKGLMTEVKQLKKDTLESFKELDTHIFEECGNSNLIMARYLQTAVHLYDDKTVFPELIQKHLYNNNNTSKLLVNLAHIIQQRKVNEVISYNFDDILEQNLGKLDLKDSVDFTTISKDAEIKGHNTLPIYHVHGIIPQNGPVDIVVFSEEEYHKRYTNAFHWSNVEQLHALSRMHCFFVGLSMTDPNLRRLLDIAHNMNMSNGEVHYAFLKRTKLEQYCVSDIERNCKYARMSGSLIDKKKQKEIYDLNYSVVENIFRELGVKVIWFEDFDNELPDLVAEVFGMTNFKDKSEHELIIRCEELIGEIQKIENSFSPSFVPALLEHSSLSYLKFKNENEYKESIKEVNNILNELSYREEVMRGDKSKINQIQKSAPRYSENLSGYSAFYKDWLEIVKELINKED